MTLHMGTCPKYGSLLVAMQPSQDLQLVCRATGTILGGTYKLTVMRVLSRRRDLKEDKSVSLLSIAKAGSLAIPKIGYLLLG